MTKSFKLIFWGCWCWVQWYPPFLFCVPTLFVKVTTSHNKVCVIGWNHHETGLCGTYCSQKFHHRKTKLISIFCCSPWKFQHTYIISCVYCVCIHACVWVREREHMCFSLTICVWDKELVRGWDWAHMCVWILLGHVSGRGVFVCVFLRLYETEQESVW